MINHFLLSKHLAQNPQILGIVLSDKDGVEIAVAYKEDIFKIKEQSSSLMYVAAINAFQEHLTKLHQTKINNFSLVYKYILLQKIFLKSSLLVHVENWSNIILTIYCTKEGNIPALKMLGLDLKEQFAKYNDAVDKQMNK